MAAYTSPDFQSNDSTLVVTVTGENHNGVIDLVAYRTDLDGEGISTRLEVELEASNVDALIEALQKAKEASLDA